MRLKFEDWITSERIGETAMDLFEEAITCYRTSAYRAALLFSYLGFLSVIRDRVLASKRPSGFDEGSWDSICTKLTDDSRWDRQAFDTTQMKPPRRVFVVTDELRRQVSYWRERRNDCAHHKGNEIDYSHVECLWLFIRSNLAKFVVSGSREGLLNTIQTHFDRSRTPAGADYSYILEQLPQALETAELPEFFKGVHQMLRPPFYNRDVVGFFDSMLGIKQGAVARALVEFLRSEEDLLMEVLRFNPARLPQLGLERAFIRGLWYAKLFRPTERNDLPLYCSLLRNDLIPKAEVEEAHQRVIFHMPDVVPADECLLILEDRSFFEVLRQLVFLQAPPGESGPLADRFNWANFHTGLVVFYLDRFGIDPDVAKSLSQIFSRENHPYQLRDAINGFLAQNKERRTEFTRVFEENKIALPEHLNLGDLTESVPS